MMPQTKRDDAPATVEPKPRMLGGVGAGAVRRLLVTPADVAETLTLMPPAADDPIRRHPLPERLIVAIDGPAGTGKSSTARTLAKRLGVEFLDTGAMYRAAAALVLDARIDPADPVAVVERVRRAGLRFDWTTDPPTLLADGRSIMHRLRDADVTALVSPLAGLAELRALMVELQKDIGRAHPRLVTEGRDQGSVVFPDADLKIYLFAEARVRAARRAEQLRQAGLEADELALEQEILQRDRSDSSRRVGPLTCPQDAVRFDTSLLTFDQVVDRLEALVRKAAARGAARPAGH